MDEDIDPFNDEEAEEDTEAGPDDDGTKDEKADEATEAPAKEKVARRIVKNPQPKLNPERICGPKGIPDLLRMSKSLRFKGKGHELHDVSLIVNTLKHWGHRLFPKVTSESFFERVERLGMKRPVQGYVRRLRMGLENVDIPATSRDGDIDDDVLRGPANDDLPRDNLFESLLDRSVDDATPPSSAVAQPDQVERITQRDEEARARAERNRQLAIERRLKRMAEQRSLATQHDSSVPNDSEVTMNGSAASTSRNGRKMLLERESSPQRCSTSANADADEETERDGNINCDAFLTMLDGNYAQTEVDNSLLGSAESGAIEDGTSTSPVPKSQDLAPLSIGNGQSEEVPDSEANTNFTALRDTQGTPDTLTDRLDSMIVHNSGTQSNVSSSVQYDSENANVDTEIAKNAIRIHESKSVEVFQDHSTITMETIRSSETVSMATCSSGGLTQEMYTASEPIFDSPEAMDVE